MDYQKLIDKFETPLFVYDVDALRKRVLSLKEYFKGIDLIYAIKANTYIVKEIEDIIDGYEICSRGEFEICDHLNIPESKMVISGVNKDDDFLTHIFSKYKNIKKMTIESLFHYELLKKYAEKENVTINALIRLTSGNQFGVSESDFLEIINNPHPLIRIEGLQYFSGTQKTSLKKLHKEIEYINSFIDKVIGETGFIIKEVEFGPGLPVMYFEGQEFDEDSFLKELVDGIKTLKAEKISCELGRSIAASCGSYLTRVVDIKENQNGNFVIVDGGINHLVYYGQMMAMKKPPFEYFPKRDTNLINYNIYGSLCTINDIIFKNAMLTELKKGDTFVFKKTGAYSSTEGINLFLSRDLPKILLYKNNEFILVRENLKTSKINFPNYNLGGK